MLGSDVRNLENLLYNQLFAAAKHNFQYFIEDTWTDGQLVLSKFHKQYYKILDLFAKGVIKKLIITVPPQHGKLLPSNTPVLTTKGWKNHGDLTTKDIVFGQDGKPKRVLGNTGIYDWSVQEMTFNDGNKILCSKEHLWSINVDYDDKKGRVKKTLEAGDIFEKRNRRSPSIDISPSLDIEQKELPIDPYILGCWLGDGHSRQGVLTVGKEDIEHFKKLGSHKEVKPGVYRVLIEGLSKRLRISGLIQNKHIPIEYLLSSHDQRIELLRGLMDTDGYVDKRGNCEFSQKKSQLAKDVHVLIRSLGYKSRYKIYDAYLNKKCVGKKVRIGFNPNRDDKVFNLERKQYRLSNKSTKDRDDKRKFFIKSFGGEPKIVKGNCIHVEGGMYLAGYDLIPTHNSEGSTRKLPSYILGRDKNKKIGIASYKGKIAEKFNRDIKRTINQSAYSAIFPETRINSKNVVTSSGWINTQAEFEVIDSHGKVKAVGVGGDLTSETIDVQIMDDLYKDWKEATSPTISERVWDWFVTVSKTRGHNDSQELIVFTRWDDNDIVGRLEQKGHVINASDFESLELALEACGDEKYLKINFPAIKEGPPTWMDPREPGEPLYPERHSLKKLKEIQELDPIKFDSLYQGNPENKEGRMYKGFGTYSTLPKFRVIKSYTDVADQGDDYLCTFIYGIPEDENNPFIYILDIVYTQESAETSELKVAEAFNLHKPSINDVESNNGGKAYARNVEKLSNDGIYCDWFHQGENKFARIYTNSAVVQRRLLFPQGWDTRWPEAYAHLTKYPRNGRAKFHDIADVATGVIEKCSFEHYVD
jgi:predicted phage terminase large subunit-like protein